ncbi:MAG: hypothetical protein HOO95_05690 [Gallionella sp.]|nr:hypothetical protein [Gallionella sp.]
MAKSVIYYVAVWMSLIGVVANGAENENNSSTASRSLSLLQRLHVPQPSDSWEIDSYFGGYRVKLALPKELDRIDALPEEIRGSVRQRIEFRRRNIDVLRKSAMDMDRILSKNRVAHVAEYEQKLERVVMSLPPSQINGTESPMVLHEPVLNALPDYTKVDFFLQESLIPQVTQRLQMLGMEHRVRLHGEQEYEFNEAGISLRHHTTRWMRDVFWLTSNQTKPNQTKPNQTRSGQGSILLLPLAFYQINDLSRPDNDYVRKLEDVRHKVVRVPLFFKGGNLLVGSADKRRILFIGEDELKLNQDFYYNAFFYFPPQKEVLELFRQLAGADEVRILPNSKHLFHLDMMMAVLNPKTVALIKPVDADALDKNDHRVIAEARQILMEYGFRMVDIPTLADWVNTFKSPINIIPFTNRDSGRLTAFVPQFEDKLVMIKGRAVSIRQEIKQAYAEAGVEAIFAESSFYQFGGNFHCAILPVE